MEIPHAASALSRSSLKRAAVLADRMMPPEPGLVILLYHRVGRRTGSRVDIPQWLFDEQMARLATTPGVVALGDALDQVETGALATPSPVVVTFDDGTADFVDVAIPILARYSIPVTLYLATGFVEDQRPFPVDCMPATWAGLRDTLSTGLVTIGSHTHSHLLLDRASTNDVADDLDRSIELIGDRLGSAPRHFAYPKALLGTPAAQREIASRFVSAALAGTRPNPLSALDRYRLHRSPIQIEDGLRFFAEKAAGGLRLEDELRRLANRRRFAGLKT